MPTDCVWKPRKVRESELRLQRHDRQQLLQHLLRREAKTADILCGCGHGDCREAAV
jgi:aerobic-type carbon monoxide dehydrogenase small subunit (CoxS/CutS family)